MFDLHGNDRLTFWKQFRNHLEVSEDPISETLDLWKKAPIVSRYLNSFDPTSWPDPWHIVLDNKYDDLALALGILYTLQLTERFNDEKFEIHMSINDNKDDQIFFLSIGENTVLNVSFRSVEDQKKFDLVEKKKIW